MIDAERALSSLRRLPTTAAIGLAFACGDFGHASGVFLPAQAPDSQAVQVPAGEREGRFVRIAHDELRRARAEVGDFGRSRLLFNVGERVEFDVTVDRTAWTPDGYTLSGHIDGGKGGFLTLAVHQRAVAGSIWTWGANYEVAHVGGGVHAVRQAADEPFACGGVAPAPSVELRAPAPASYAGDDAAVVDIVAFWTPALEAARGGESEVKLAIDLAVAYANDALERSGALVSLNLIGAERLDVEEVSMAQVLDVLKGEHAHGRADTLGADFISAFVALNHGGLAGGRESVVGNADAWVFAHEVGHNLGLLHDRGAWLVPSYSYNGGYTSLYTNYARILCGVTIMSYTSTCLSAGLQEYRRIPFYSTPNRYSLGTGRPLGVSRLSNVRDLDGPADAVLRINRNRHRKSDIRRRRPAP